MDASDEPRDDERPPTPSGGPGGFAWGLTPGATTPPAPAPVEPTVAPAPAAAPPPPLVEPTPTPAPPAAAPSTPSWELPTQALPATPSWEQPTQPAEPIASVPPVAVTPPSPVQADGALAATDLLGSPAAAPAEVVPDTAPDSALDTLFGEQNFVDYDAEPQPLVPPMPRPRARRETREQSSEPRISSTHITKPQRVLLIIAGALVLMLALVALFLLGTRLAAVFAATPAEVPVSSDEPVAPVVAGPVEPGVWAWDELLGGECIDPFDDPWAEEFTVVDCADAHPAQLVARAELPVVEGAGDAFPGEEALLTQVAELCTAAGVVDLTAAGAYPDLQVQGTYPATAEQWDADERYYACFVSRISGEPLTGSIAVVPADDATTDEETPTA